MNYETITLLGTLLILLFTLLVLIWQTWLNRMDMRKNSIRNIYMRWLEINKLEIEYPELHKMFMDAKMLQKLEKLPKNELRKRALSLFIFDQFAMIYNLGERKSLYIKIDPHFKKLFKKGKILDWWINLIDRKRTLLDINESYIRRIMTNPEIIKCWRNYKLGETWKGSKYYDYINNIINSTQRYSKEYNRRNHYSRGKEDIVKMYNEIAEQYTTAFFNPETLQIEMYYLEKFLSFVNKGGKILDVGCGPGIETKFIIDKGFIYEGIDLSRNMIEIAKKKNPTATFQIMDMRKLKYPDNNFDGIMALESLIHFPRYEVHAIITDFCRILKPGGALLLALQKGKCEKLIPFPFSKENKFLLTPFTKDEIKNLLHEFGFKVVYITVRKPVPMEYKFDKLVVIAKKKEGDGDND